MTKTYHLHARPPANAHQNLISDPLCRTCSRIEGRHEAIANRRRDTREERKGEIVSQPRCTGSRDDNKDKLADYRREKVNSAHRRSFTLDGLEIRRKPVRCNGDTADQARPERTARPHGALAEQVAWKHRLVALIVFPGKEDQGENASANE